MTKECFDRYLKIMTIVIWAGLSLLVIGAIMGVVLLFLNTKSIFYKLDIAAILIGLGIILAAIKGQEIAEHEFVHKPPYF